MNPDTGHLVSAEKVKELRELFGDLHEAGYEEVPKEFHDAAELELAGKEETYVGMKSTGSINTWAAKQRAKRQTMRKARKLCCR